MNTWAESKQQIGQFTGSTGANILTQAELNAGFQAWARKVQFILNFILFFISVYFKMTFKIESSYMVDNKYHYFNTIFCCLNKFSGVN